eukprot:10914658-Lingulodinium_polyedra.AAC.1
MGSHAPMHGLWRQLSHEPGCKEDKGITSHQPHCHHRHHINIASTSHQHRMHITPAASNETNHNIEIMAIDN